MPKSIFLEKNKRNIIDLSSAEFAERVVPVSILHKSIAGRVADGPITARCRFFKECWLGKVKIANGPFVVNGIVSDQNVRIYRLI